MPEETTIQLSVLNKITDKEKSSVLRMVKFIGHGYHNRRIDSNFIKRAGLEPRYKINFSDCIIFLSPCFKLPWDNYIAVLAFVEKEGEVLANTYYISASHALWTYLPGVNPTGKASDEALFFDKGHGEGFNGAGQSLFPDDEFQLALFENLYAEKPLIINQEHYPTHRILASTAPKKWNDNEYYDKTNEKPYQVAGCIYTKWKKLAPEIVIPTKEDERPVFDNLLASWSVSEVGLYEDGLIYEVFPSKNGILRFLFARDPHNRFAACLHVSVVAGKRELTGLKEIFVAAADLTTPLYEHYKIDVNPATFAGFVQREYMDHNDRKNKGRYRGMYGRYLSQVPVIQEYLQARGNNSK